MKTKSTVGRLITHFSKWLESGARVAAMLLLLCTTALPAWASGYQWDKTINDEGGGEVRFRGQNYNSWDSDWGTLYKFKTNKTFNPANDQFYWEFNMYVNYGHHIDATYDYYTRTAYKGEESKRSPMLSLRSL